MAGSFRPILVDSSSEISPPRLYSVVIPALDEEGSLPATVSAISGTLSRERISHEIVVVDDGSSDRTWDELETLTEKYPTVRRFQNHGPHGFGNAIVCGLDHARGDAVVIMMADCSDDPEDAVVYWKKLSEGYECVFGSRFVRGGKVIDYPKLKLMLNRTANLFIKTLFNISLNDTTNAFKAYRREVIDGCRPILSPHFNLTVELPLKAIVRGYRWTVVPISWRNRVTGQAKLKIKEMGSRYFFICMYVWFEKYFSRGDYHRQSSGH